VKKKKGGETGQILISGVLRKGSKRTDRTQGREKCRGSPRGAPSKLGQGDERSSKPRRRKMKRKYKHPKENSAEGAPHAKKHKSFQVLRPFLGKGGNGPKV